MSVRGLILRRSDVRQKLHPVDVAGPCGFAASQQCGKGGLVNMPTNWFVGVWIGLLAVLTAGCGGASTEPEVKPPEPMPKLAAPASFRALVVHLEAPLPAVQYRPAVMGALMEAGVRVVEQADQPHDVTVELQAQAATFRVLESSSGQLPLTEYDYALAALVTRDGRSVVEVRVQITERSSPTEVMSRSNHAVAWLARALVAKLVQEPPMVALAKRFAEERGELPVADAGPTVASATAVPNGERRSALVVGNAAYRAGRLANPVHDAQAMSKALRAAGFTVAERHDIDQKQMKRAFIEFGQRLRQGGVGLFYFAGHGLQVKGRNYLVPLGADLRSEAHVDVEAVPLAQVLAEMDAASNRLNVVILDACRNNPFARSYRSAARGLALVDAPQGTLVAYATAPGSVAADGDRGQGTYTAALVRHLSTPGLPVESVFKAVRRDVQKATGGAQVPWESSSLTGELVFVPADSGK